MTEPEQWAVELWHAADDAAAECARDEAGHPNYAAAIVIQRAFEEQTRELREAAAMAVGEMSRARGRLETIAICNEDRRIAAALGGTCDHIRRVFFPALATRQPTPPSPSYKQPFARRRPVMSGRPVKPTIAGPVPTQKGPSFPDPLASWSVCTPWGSPSKNQATEQCAVVKEAGDV